MAWPDLLPGCSHWHLKMCEHNPTSKLCDEEGGSWCNLWRKYMQIISYQQQIIVDKSEMTYSLTSIDKDFQTFLFSILCSQKQRGDVVVI